MSLWDTYADWDEVAQNPSIDFIRTQTVLDGPWRSNSCSLLLEEYVRRTQIRQVIDFGCGLGRNLLMLRSLFANVIGVDILAMLRRADLSGYDKAVTSDLVFTDLVLPTVIYDSVCWQHLIDEDYVQQLASRVDCSTVQAVCSVSFPGVVCGTLEALKNLGWRVYGTEQDMTSFAIGHTVVLLERA